MRAKYLSPVQKELLVEFLENHDNLKSGKFSATFNFKSAQRLWIELANMLNRTPGARKDWRQWRKTWQDLRTKTKYKESALNKLRADNGIPGQFVENLTPIEERILAIIKNQPKTVTEQTVDPLLSFSLNETNEIRTKHEPVDDVDEVVQEDNVDYQEDYYQPEPIEPAQMFKICQIQSVEEKVTDSANSFADCKHANAREQYYQKKLELLERDVAAKNRIAKALETIASKLDRNNVNF